MSEYVFCRRTLDSVLQGLHSEDDSTQLRAIIASVETMLDSSPKQEWVKVRERLPEALDGDEAGNVWWIDRYGSIGCGRVPAVRMQRDLFTHWMPKPRLAPPEPPEDE